MIRGIYVIRREEDVGGFSFLVLVSLCRMGEAMCCFWGLS